MSAREKMCAVLCGCCWQSGQRGKGCEKGLILCKYSFKRVEWLDLSCASVLRVCLSSLVGFYLIGGVGVSWCESF